MDHKLTLWQEWFKGYQLHGIQVLQAQDFLASLMLLHGHHVVGSLQLLGVHPMR